jgi:hypothetical protein
MTRWGKGPRPADLRSTTARGYGSKHRALRAQVAKQVERGEGVCWRCSQPIPPGTPFDLGHDDHDRTLYRGPEHRHRTGRCPGNRAAGAIKGNKARAKPGRTLASEHW